MNTRWLSKGKIKSSKTKKGFRPPGKKRDLTSIEISLIEAIVDECADKINRSKLRKEDPYKFILRHEDKRRKIFILWINGMNYILRYGRGPSIRPHDDIPITGSGTKRARLYQNLNN